MPSIAATLERIKQDLQLFLPEADVTAACREAGHQWRERQCGPVKTIHLFLLQVLCFNTAMTHLRLLAQAAVAAPAYCRARMRLPLEVLQKLLRRSAVILSGAAAERWCGLRPLLVDGLGAMAPDTPASQKAFGRPGEQKPGCGFPLPKVLGLFDAATGLILELLAFPLRTHEQSKVWKLHPLLAPGDLLVGDRGLCTFAHLAMLAAQGCTACSACISGKWWIFARIVRRVGKPNGQGDDRARTETNARPSVPVGTSQGDGKAGRRRAHL